MTTTIPPEELWTETRDGARLALLRCARRDSSRPPVLLAHGTFGSAAICTRLAAYLVDQGFDTWIFEWRGHGKSARGPVEADYETYATHDVAAAVSAVLEATARPSLLYVGHSAGGVLPWMYLAREPLHAVRFQGIVSLASQTTHAGRALGAKLALGIGAAVTNALGRAPAKLFKLGPNDESRAMMRQWFRWNTTGRWIGQGDFDYPTALRELRVPALVFAGGGDRFIAPLAGCRALFDALGAEDKTFVHCSTSEGFREDYDHGRIVASSSAAAEIWPRIAEWLTRVGASATQGKDVREHGHAARS